MKLELVVDEVAVPWSPESDWIAAVRALVGESGPADGALEVVLTDDAALSEQNQRYRDVDGPTDVLSFSYLEGHEDARERLLRGEVPVATFLDDPVQGEEVPLAGSILVSVPYVVRRGPVHQPDLESEMVFMVVHGLLHVLGYDHADDEQRAQMQAEEERSMQRWWRLRESTSSGGAATIEEEDERS